MRWTGRVIVLAASPSPVNFGGQTGLSLQRAARAVAGVRHVAEVCSRYYIGEGIVKILM
jgi:hypothetical protein